MAFSEHQRKMKRKWDLFHTRHQAMVRRWQKMVNTLNYTKFGVRITTKQRIAIDMNPINLLRRINAVSE